jgi:hypothetical protein
MHYSYEHAKRMNGIALKKFEDVTKCYWMLLSNCDISIIENT